MLYILHIGQSKTGTSSLQSFLAENRHKLIEQGIYYPDVYRNGVALNIIEHNSIADSLAGYKRHPGFPAEEYFKQFKKQAKKVNCNTLLLSGENFFGGLPQIWDLPKGTSYSSVYRYRLEQLKHFIGDANIRIVIYLRRQDEWIETAISHVIRYEGLLKHPVYKNDAQMVDLLMPRMDYAALLDLWQDIINPEEIITVPYVRSSLINGNIISDFLNQIKLNEEDFKLIEYKKRNHPSLSTEFIELKKQLNTHKKSKTKERTTISILNDLDKAIGSGEKYKINLELKKEMMTTLSQSNQRLKEVYGLDFPSTTTKHAPDKSSKTSATDPNALLSLFEQKYHAPRARLLSIRYEIARLLRNKAPFLHAIARQIVSTLAKITKCGPTE